MTTYVEPHAPLRNAVVAVALLLIVGGVLLKVYASYQKPPSGPPEEVIRFVASQARLAAIFFTGVFAAWSSAVLWLAYKTITSGTWPPTGTPTPVRLKVITNPSRTVVLLVAAVFILGKGAVAGLAWRYYLAVQEVAEFVAR
ncbi:MAG: hypothetical protein ACXW3L_11885 [Limisphaerales bacterium]